MDMKKRLYVETSIISYLTSRLSRDLVIAARQELTREMWPILSSEFEVYISALVVQEVGQGDADASALRLRAVNGLPVLEIAGSAEALARTLITEGVIPDTHLEDALHVAVAASNGMDFLLTWNFAHINNAFTRSRIRDVIESEGYACPEFCSPEELLGEQE